MSRKKKPGTPCRVALALLIGVLGQPGFLRGAAGLPGTGALEGGRDLPAEMLAGISRFLDRETAASPQRRSLRWQRDGSSPDAYERSIAPNRARLARLIGAVDERRRPADLELVATWSIPARMARTDGFAAYAVRWPVLEGVHGEGLLLVPNGPVLARMVVVPDAGQIPEILAGLAPGLPRERQLARRLAENGCEVLIPTLISRDDTFSGSPRLNLFRNQPHREWIYRQAYELGRHVIGYEVLKILSAADCLEARGASAPIAVAGYAEGGLLALHAAALDTRFSAALVSASFGPRENLWEEPIYRNLFGLLEEFGDAEIASLIAPRTLIVEHALAPEVAGPPPPRGGRSTAAPGRITTPPPEAVTAEVERVRRIVPSSIPFPLHLVRGAGGEALEAGSEEALAALLRACGLPRGAPLAPPGIDPVDTRSAFDPGPRQERQVRELERFTQRLLQLAGSERDAFFWNRLQPQSPQHWQEAVQPFKEIFWDEVIGRFPVSDDLPLHPRSRRILDAPAWTGYEVVLDVLPDVFAWGYLLLPKDLKPDERRPVVVCQHGLEGVPAQLINEDPESRDYRVYKAFAARLAERGFIVFVPHNPYRGGDSFRVLQRKANPLGKSLFSIILAQHERILDWLGAQPFVDPERIGFYGLSYGGKTAMRVPALLERYRLSICSGDFNEWIWKNVTTDWPRSYMFVGEYEMFEFNLGMTFNYAEMAALIAPRPFMVERGHNDGVGLDEWVAFEYAKVNRLYAKLGIPERTEIEYFDGPHTIHGEGAFDFLHRHLDWPVPAGKPAAFAGWGLEINREL